jgi:hypothetical protein
MGTKYRFWVDCTQKDIDKGIINNSSKCVVAQSLARAKKDARRIVVDTQTIRFTEGDQRLVYLTPFVVQQYVVAFDAGDLITPFRFQLRDPVKAKTAHLTPTGKKRMKEYNRKIRSGSAAQRATATMIRKDGESPLVEYSHERQAPPTVYRNRNREYGMRALRVNRMPKDHPSGPISRR